MVRISTKFWADAARVTKQQRRKMRFMDRSMRKLSEIWSAIERVARAHGVVRLGASGLDDAHAELFDEWIARGDHATMSYLAKNAAIRHDPGARFPWAKS